MKSCPSVFGVYVEAAESKPSWSGAMLPIVAQ